MEKKPVLETTEKKINGRWVAAIGAIALALGAMAWQMLPVAAAEETQPVYKETAVQRGSIVVGVSESGTATIEAEEISCDFATEVEEIYVKAGQSVKAGDVIAKVSTDSIADEQETLQLTLEKAQAALEEALISQKVKTLTAAQTLKSNSSLSDTAQTIYESTVEQLEYDTAQNANSIDQIEDDISYYSSLIKGYSDDGDKVDELEDARDLAKETLDALKSAPVQDSGAIVTATVAYNEANSSYVKAKEEYEEKLDKAETELENLQNDYDAAILKYRSGQAGLTTSQLEAEATLESNLLTSENAETLYELEIAQLQSTVTSAQLSVKEAEKALGDLAEISATGLLTAPCDGLVMSVSYKAGDEVAAKSAIATIADSQNVYVSVSLSQDDISQVSLGSKANVQLSSYEEKFTGAVDSISIVPARSGASTVSYTVSVKLEGETGKIYEGMTGDVTFVTKELPDVLYVSNKAVSTTDGKSYVKIKDAAGETRQVEVTTGFSDGKNVEVLSGLTEGDVALIESQVRSK